MGVVPGILRGYLDFKERGKSDRRERWPTAAWWTAFLGTEESLRLQVAPRDVSLEKSLQWLLRQVSPAFARVYDSGLHPRLVQEMLANGRRETERVSRQHGEMGTIKAKPP